MSETGFLAHNAPFFSTFKPLEAGGGRFESVLSEFVYTRTYSRWNEEEARRESWPETVDRYVAFLAAERKLPAPILETIRASILSMDVLPSMRALWAAGDAMRKDNTCGYNCSFVPLDSLPSFSELLYILMMGTGVGFSVERRFVDNLPTVAPLTGETVTHIIPDSTIGWADSFLFGLRAWFQGIAVEFDYSLVRPEGAPLKTKGGRASGPAPLRRLLDFAQKTILAASGRKLRSIEAHDIGCMVGEIVMAGGVRRAALISFSDPDDEEMRHAKDWSRGEFPTLRYMANNSAYWQDRPSKDEFWREWTALRNSGSGERGFYHTPSAKMAVRRGECRSNPCGEIQLRFSHSTDPWTGEGGGGQFCVAGDTPLITREGVTTIRDAVNRPIHIWNGEQWSEVRPFQTGIGQKIYRVQFSDGSYLDCTDYHRFSVSTSNTRTTKTPWREMALAEIREAGVDKIWATQPFEIRQDEGEVVDDTYTLGAAVGDGWIRKTSGGGQPNPRVYTGLWGAKDAVMPIAGIRGVPHVANAGNTALLMTTVFCPAQNPELVASLKADPDALNLLFTWCRDSILQFMAGWIDADGSETGTGGVRLYISGETRARRAQLLLTRCGIRSSVCLLQEAGTETNFGPRTQDLWYLQITDCADLPCHRVDTSGGHPPRFKSKFQTIKSITELPGLHATFCFEEPLRHMGVFGNTLTFQCNLSAAVMRANDTRASFAEKVRVATWIGAIQATFTDFPYLRPAWKQHCDEDRLLGVDITGQCDAPHLSQDMEAMSFFNQVARETAAEATAYLGVNYPAAITCGKPSGNSSQLVDCASGFHARFSQFYIRRVRIAQSDPLFRLIKEVGVPLHKDNQFADWPDAECPTWVAEFPVKAPAGAIFRDAETAVQMLERYMLVMRTWCGERGHNQSVTVYVKDHEWDEVGNWLFEHFDEVTGISFLPYDGGKYKLAPYEEIDETTYNRWLETFPASVDFSRLTDYEREDRGQGSVELACSAGGCEIDWNALAGKQP